MWDWELILFTHVDVENYIGFKDGPFEVIHFFSNDSMRNKSDVLKQIF